VRRKIDLFSRVYVINECVSNQVFHAFSTVVFLLAATASFGADSSDVNKALHLDTLHEAAPDIELLDGAGATSHLVDYHGKNVILHFWASWCEPCKKELAQLDQLAKAGTASGVVLVPISGDDSAQPKQVKDARKFLASVPGHLPFFLAAPGKGRDRFLTWGVPVTYFIDRSGKLIARALGPRDWSAQPDLPELLAKIFGEEKK
jgi:thiol-disulfide isomerase/thioredoxin